MTMHRFTSPHTIDVSRELFKILDFVEEKSLARAIAAHLWLEAGVTPEQFDDMTGGLRSVMYHPVWIKEALREFQEGRRDPEKCRDLILGLVGQTHTLATTRRDRYQP